MERRPFGNSELTVSAVALGCWIFGVDWWGHYTDEQRAGACANSALDQGITFFDNGDAYGNGRAETAAGAVPQVRPRPHATRIQIGSEVRLRLLLRPRQARQRTSERQAGLLPGKFMRYATRTIAPAASASITIDLYMAHNIKLPQFNDELWAELEKVKGGGEDQACGA